MGVPHKERGDILTSIGVDAPNPKLEIEFDLSPLPCDSILTLLSGLKLPRTTRVQKPTYLPGNFQVHGAVEGPIYGRPGVNACADTPQGGLHVRIRHDGASIHSIDRNIVGTILSSATRSAGAPDVMPIPDPPPQIVTLPASGLTVRLPSADTTWQVFSRAVDDGTLADFIERTSPNSPALVVRLHFVRDRNKVCKRSEQIIPSKGVVVNRPNYLSPEWSQGVIEEAGGSIHESLICGDLVGGGTALVKIIYGASLRDRDLNDVRPVLSALAQAVGLRQNAGRTLGPATTSATYSSPSSGSTPSYSYDDDEDARLSRWELGAFQLSPEAQGLDKSLGAFLAVDYLSITPESTVSFALQAGLSIGFDSASNIPFDGRGSLGLGLSVGPVILVPLVGIGLDTIGGGDENSYKIPFGWYWDVEGRLRLSFDDDFAIDASALRATRTGNDPDGETRFSAYVNKAFGGSDRLWSLGFRYINYGGQGKLIGASLGSTL